MRRRLVTSYLAIALLVLLLLEVPLGFVLASREFDRLESDVVGDAVVLTALVEEDLERGVEEVVLGPDVLAYAAEAEGRIVVTDASGISVADTAAAVPRDFSTRPEVRVALGGNRSTGRRSSETLGDELVYVAVPVASRGQVLGVVRITYPTEVVRGRIAAQLWVLVAVAVVVLVATAIVAIRLAGWTLRPVARIGEAVQRFGEGDLDARADVVAGPPEMVELADRIDDMAERIADLVQVQRSFVADASHQLRTPLTGLRLELENLEAGVEDGAVREALERAVDGSRRLARIIDGLLALARLEGQRPELEPVDPVLLVARAHDTWSALAGEAGVRLVVDAPDEVPAARGVPDDLSQVLDVVLDNALAVSPRGSRIRLGVEADAGVVTLVVDDEGPGMDADERARAFDRRWQGPTATGGDGLGLAIAHRLAVASGARVVLHEAPRGGLRVRIVLAGDGSTSG